MSSNLPVRRSSLFGALSSDRATGKALATVQTGAFLERAEDEARRNLSIAKISDIGMATRHALAEGDEIVHDLAGRLQGNEFGAVALGGIAEDGVRGVRRELRRLSEGW
ncbi:MAG TPA: hypothetical protein VHU13_01350 [Solirubrobacteraceae bacterium]|jgi:chloramphenicol 3-O-phosphotransferase|nr:hypothetical protein [Solirubrobacteraceae bacterium]